MCRLKCVCVLIRNLRSWGQGCWSNWLRAYNYCWASTPRYHVISYPIFAAARPLSTDTYLFNEFTNCQSRSTTDRGLCSELYMHAYILRFAIKEERMRLWRQSKVIKPSACAWKKRHSIPTHDEHRAVRQRCSQRLQRASCCDDRWVSFSDSVTGLRKRRN